MINKHIAYATYKKIIETYPARTVPMRESFNPPNLALAQPRLSYIWKSKISWHYRLTANDDNPLSSFLAPIYKLKFSGGLHISHAPRKKFPGTYHTCIIPGTFLHSAWPLYLSLPRNQCMTMINERIAYATCKKIIETYPARTVPMIFLHSAQPLPPIYRLIFPAVCAHISCPTQKSSWDIPYTYSPRNFFTFYIPHDLYISACHEINAW